MSPAQCRAARALLNWSQDDLVSLCRITKKTIADFERGATIKPHPASLEAIGAAFEASGIEFITRGVRIRASSRRKRPTRNEG